MSKPSRTWSSSTRDSNILILSRQANRNVSGHNQGNKTQYTGNRYRHKTYSQTNKQSHASPQLPAQEIFPSTKKPNRRTTIIDFISTIIQPRMANPTSFCLFKYCSFIPNVNPLKNTILQTRPLDAFSNIVLCHRRRYLKQQSSYFLKIFSIWSIFYYTLYFFEKEANIHRLNCLSTMVT